MKSKYLVIQTDIGSGTQWGTNQTINPIREIFMPSVEKYCKKHNYEYFLVKKSSYKHLIGDLNFLPTENKHYSFERYFHFNNDYKYTVYLDNDIYIYDDAEPFPKISGLMVAREAEGNTSSLFRELNKLDTSFGYYNSGVMFCDNLTSKYLKNYMVTRAKKNIRAKGKNSDNMMLNEFIIENLNLLNEIEPKWNYMPFFSNYEKIQNPNFFHFVGIIGKEILNRLQEKEINVEFFLKELKFENKK